MNDCTVGQTQYTVLKVEKCDKVTGTATSVFTHRKENLGQYILNPLLYIKGTIARDVRGDKE